MMKPSKRLMELLDQQPEYHALADETEKLRDQVDKWVEEQSIGDYLFNTMRDIDTNMLKITTFQSKVITEFAECALNRGRAPKGRDAA